MTEANETRDKITVIASDAMDDASEIEPGVLIVTIIAMPIGNGDYAVRGISNVGKDTQIGMLTNYTGSLSRSGEEPSFIGVGH